jgi:hypothetical protein
MNSEMPVWNYKAKLLVTAFVLASCTKVSAAIAEQDSISDKSNDFRFVSYHGEYIQLTIYFMTQSHKLR